MQFLGGNPVLQQSPSRFEYSKTWKRRRRPKGLKKRQKKSVYGMREKIDNCVCIYFFYFTKGARNFHVHKNTLFFWVTFDLTENKKDRQIFVKLSQFEFYNSRNISLNYCIVNARRLRKTLTWKKVVSWLLPPDPLVIILLPRETWVPLKGTFTMRNLQVLLVPICYVAKKCNLFCIHCNDFFFGNFFFSKVRQCGSVVKTFPN